MGPLGPSSALRGDTEPSTLSEQLDDHETRFPIVLLVAAGSGGGDDAWRSFWGWAGSLTGGLSGLPTAGNPVAAIAWAAVLFLATLAFIPGVRQGRAFAITALLFTALAFVLYAPGLLTRIGV